MSAGRMRRLICAALTVLAAMPIVSTFAVPGDAPLRVTHGPFEVMQDVRKVSTGAFPNISGNPFARMPVSAFSINWRGSRVVLPGRGNGRSSFWQVLVLKGAPRPALLVADSDFYLLTEDDGKLVVRRLCEAGSNIASVQWLDEVSGQPGATFEVSVRDKRGEPLDLVGGRLLLLNRELVLDVQTLQGWTLRPYDEINRTALDGFNASNEPALALSPSGSQIVFFGSRRADTGTEYALFVIEYANNRAYVVPFDANAARLESKQDGTPTWFAQHFSWNRDARGRERIQWHSPKTPLPIQGRFVDFGPDKIEYRLRPAIQALQTALVGFIEREWGARQGKVAVLDEQQYVELAIDGHTLTVSFDGADKRVVLYSAEDHPESRALVQEIGTKFNTVLAAGQYQSLFATPGSGAR